MRGKAGFGAAPGSKRRYGPFQARPKHQETTRALPQPIHGERGIRHRERRARRDSLGG